MSKPCVLITGGAGFIGFHATRHFLQRRWNVVVVDDLSRVGSRYNIEMLQTMGQFHFEKCDIRDLNLWPRVFSKCRPRMDLLIHLAAQTTVLDSLEDPRKDFEVNCLGTFNLLEGLRRLKPAKRPQLAIFASTNKVYGDLSGYALSSNPTRYNFMNGKEGIAETQTIDFYSPYGCSKGSADQYARDYYRSYGIGGVVLRQSCVYGTQQFGIEEQGWIAHVGIQGYLGRPIMIYGDGRQVRDVLYIDDLLRLYEMLFKNSNVAQGKIYNVGGGPERAISFLELISMVESRIGKRLKVRFSPWRKGDQKIFITDTDQLKEDIGWYPKVSVETGLERLLSWIETHAKTISKILDEAPSSNHKKVARSLMVEV